MKLASLIAIGSDYGSVVTRRLRAMGSGKPIRQPAWQNGFADG